MNDIKVSFHFSLKEFECPCCKRVKLDERLLMKLEALRILYGKPLVITSGYRCEKHNREVGGSERSLHLEGKAADIRIAEREQGKILMLCKLLGLRVIPYGKRNFVHVDIGGGANGYLPGHIKPGISYSSKLLSSGKAGARNEGTKRGYLLSQSGY